MNNDKKLVDAEIEKLDTDEDDEEEEDDDDDYSEKSESDEN